MSNQGPKGVAMSTTPDKASGTTRSVTVGTATRLTPMLKGWMSPVMPTVAGTNTTAMDNWGHHRRDEP